MNSFTATVRNEDLIFSPGEVIRYNGRLQRKIEVCKSRDDGMGRVTWSVASLMVSPRATRQQIIDAYKTAA